MTVLHATWLPRIAGYEGIVAKLADLQASADEHGIPLQVHVLTDDVAAADGILRPIRRPAGVAAGIARLSKGRSILRSLPIDDAQAVILRYPGAVDASLPLLGRELAGRLLTEHHTNEVEELRLARFGALRAAIESALAPPFLRGLAGGVAVTAELAEAARCRGLRKPILVQGNGIRVARMPFTGSPAWHGGPLRVLMVSGIFWDWQGLDRVLRGMLAAPAGDGIELHLVGRIASIRDRELIERCSRLARSRVIEHGTLLGADLDRLSQTMHLALSTLALHRKAMREACPLKSREYAARGLPFIYAYTDPDLPDGCPGWLRVPSDDAPLPLATLFAFAAATARGGGVSERMRDHARLHLDFSAKAAGLVRHALAASGGRWTRTS